MFHIFTNHKFFSAIRTNFNTN